jgi:predicted O-linked N-acetylglucosamine transferase (SPINDLY family)
MSFDPAQPTLAQAIQLHQSGRLDQAESIYRQLLATSPNSANILHLLGMLLFQKGQRKEGLAHLRHAVNSDPSVAIYHLNFGSALAQDGQVQEAIAETRKALALTPDHAQAHFNLAHLLETCQQWEDAAASYRRAIQLNPNFAPAHNNLGNVLYSLGRSEEAEASYSAALHHRPLDSKTHKNLGRALHDLGRLSEAADAYRHAMELDPKDSEAHNDLGTVLASTRHFDDAIAAFQTALSIRPDDTTAMTNLGNALKDTGRVDEAIAWFTRALEMGADSRTGSCLNVVVHLHPDYDPQRILQVHQQWEHRFARPFAPISDFYPNDPSPTRRLKIGYVSPSFSDHIVGHCIIGLLSNHDHDAFEIYCYSDTRRPDWMTDRLHATADVWRNTVGLSDEQLTSLIRQDQIDILVDLNMHMDRNRMLVFARKPAPVQITWIGYPSTTGLRTIDYRLSDPHLDPPGLGSDEKFYSEKTLHLPDSYWIYHPLEDLPPPNDLPALRNGYITFGCLNSFIKVSDPCLRLWARVLREVGNSRLILLAPEGSSRQRVLNILKHEGIDPTRITFFDRHPRRKYMELYQQFDLGLDTTPYAGHTTTLDSLWMGVPVISTTGRTAVSRGGLSILSNVGLAEHCTHSEERFVSNATQSAMDLGQLADLRRTLRHRMSQSPLLDGPRFARDVEAAYRETWSTWIKSRRAEIHSPSSPVVDQPPGRFHIVTMWPPNHPQSATFDDLSRLLQFSLESLGFPVTADLNNFRPDAVNVVLGYHLLKDPIDAYWIPYQLEQLSVEGRRTSEWLNILSRAPEIWDYDPENIAYLESQGIRSARHVPIGFHPSLRVISPKPQDIDVLHYGVITERRERLLKVLSHNCRVHATTRAYGQQRNKLIAHSKIVLNLHAYEAPIFEQVRVSFLLNNGACVVTEDSPYNPYRDMAVTCPYDQIVDRCLVLLSNESERRSLAESGATRFKQMPMTDILSRLRPTRASLWRAPRAPQ